MVTFNRQQFSQPVNFDERPASAALTKTGGYLKGFTHTLQPYIGCRFGCSYCYVQGLSVHHFHQPQLAWGRYAHPRPGIDRHLAKEMKRQRSRAPHDKIAIFMSSATDPYQGLERKWQLTQACLQVFMEYPPDCLVIQTRSPLVERDFDLINSIGSGVWLSITLESDIDDVRREITPLCPSVQKRLATISNALENGLNVQIAVSPCLPYSTVEAFGALLLSHGQRIVIDTYASGDGRKGKRTAKTIIPALYQELGWDDWENESAARNLYEWIRQRAPHRVGWSQEGFTYLANIHDSD